MLSAWLSPVIWRQSDKRPRYHKYRFSGTVLSVVIAEDHPVQPADFPEGFLAI